MRLAFALLFSALLSTQTFAQNPDTTWVQTYTWEAQNNPATAYESPGRRWFDFPASDNDSTYQKVLMYYNLKCFEDGTAGNLGYACGEWDYLTYTYLFDHTGMMDSNSLTHPHWLIDDLDFVSDTLVTEVAQVPLDTVRWTYSNYELSGATSSGEAVGTFTAAPSELEWESDCGRMQWVWSADELEAMGWSGTPSVGVEWPAVASLVEARDAVQWNFYWSAADSLGGFYTGPIAASSKVSDASAPGRFVLDAPLEWDGESHLIVEVLMQLDAAPVWEADWAGEEAPQKTWQAGTAGSYVHFDGNDRIEVAVEEINFIDDAVTVEFWSRGTPEFQPENNSICEGMNADNQREINIHFPWSNGRIYWDAGFDGGYDRIDQAADANQYEGEWHHWAFTKDVATATMAIYFDGALWHSGTDKDNLFGDMVRFHIGCNGNGGNDYRGDVDEFRMWNAALTPPAVAEFYNRSVDEAHPNADDLLLNLSMDMNPELYAIGDGVTHFSHGNAGAKTYEASEAFWHPGAMPQGVRPSLIWWSGDAVAADSVVVDHVEAIPATSIAEWAVQGNTVTWESLEYGWPAETVRTTRTPSGEVLATYPLAGIATEYLNDTLTFFSVPFEVVDRYELARYITPYGIGLTLDDDGWTWVFDVSDYVHLLRDSVELQAGNWQELLDMKFAFVHGTPPRDVKRMDAFWKGQYGLSTFDGNVTDHAFAPQEGESMFRLKTRASGHGFGSGNNCAEFCYNTHSVKVNGDAQWSWEIMRECADNALYPQGGTWIYDRAGWCPGAVVDTKDFELTPLVAGQDEFSVDYDITYDPDGNYRFEGQIVAYGEPNMTYDVEISQILSPSDDKLESRWNPICESPTVRIRNNGSQLLTTCQFSYGIEGGATATYEWTGNLAFLESVEVELPYDDPSLYEGNDEEWVLFEVEVNQPNGMVDEEPRNNKSSSHFHRVPNWSYPDLDDNRVIIWTKTNQVAWETSVELLDAQGNLVWERGYPTANTTFKDTLSLNQGCYRFTVNDVGDDGQSFWANSDGSGYTRLKKVAGGNFINFEPDFGRYISQAFFFQTNLVTVEEKLPISPVSMVVFPNPSDGVFQVSLGGFQAGKSLDWLCYDAMGRLINSGEWQVSSGLLQSLDLSDLPTGTYALICYDGQGRKLSKWLQKQ